jgi:hypothetical protein
MSETRQKEIEYCRDHLEYFVDAYGHIEDKDNSDSIIQPFKMWQAQREALASIRDHKFTVVLKARQLGFTWLALHYIDWLLTCFSGRSVIALSQKEDDAKELIRRFAYVILANQTELMVEEKSKPTGWDGIVWSANALEVKIKHPNGLVSVLTGMPSSPGAGRSWTANLIFLDEWAFQSFAEEIYKSGFPTVNRPTGGQVLGLSTIERGSFFESIFTDPDNGYNKIFIPWYADPRRDAAWYERTKQAMGDAITQEYPATVEEALAVPGGAFFPEVTAKNTISKDPIDEDGKKNVIRYVCIDYGLDMFSAHWVMVDHRNHAQVYREYDSPNKTISEAASILQKMSAEEDIHLYLAPPDLWNRRQETGKSAAIIFGENGINLTKTSNDLLNGCLSMKEWLKPQVNNVTDEVEKSKLTILEGAAPNLYKCLQKIQKDKKKPNVYAKDPHDLTHDVDSLRCFCIYWTISAEELKAKKRKKIWTEDMLEDYYNADEDGKAYLVAKYGEPT